MSLSHLHGTARAGKRIFFVVKFVLLLATVIFGWWLTGFIPRSLDLSQTSDRLFAEKSVGFIPASRRVYGESVGFADSTDFYLAVMEPQEVEIILRGVPEVTRWEVPNHAPRWWKFSLWWNSRNCQMRYHQSQEKWPRVFAYCEKTKLFYGTREWE